MKRYWTLLAAVVCLCGSWCAADEEPTVSLPEIRRQAMEYVDTLRAPDMPLGCYFDSPADTTSPSLYASCDVVHMRTVMGEDLRTTLTPEQRRAWIDHINSFARPDGTYGPARKNHSPQHANGMVVGALGVLGGRQKYPVRLYDDLDGVDEIGPWLEDIDWRRQWPGSHLFWGGMHCYSMSRRCSPAWREAVFQWLDANLDRETGWWRKCVPCSRPFEPLGGGAHIWPIYQHQGRPFPCPERVIDSILALQKPDGSWLNYGNYMELDALYGLTYMSSLAPEYRREDILEAARRHGRGLIQRWPSILASEPDLHSLLAAVGAFGLLQQLLPETFVDDARWTDIFSDARLYQTASVEAVEGETDIPSLLHRVNDWQIAHPRMKPNDRNWERGTWYTGVMAAYKSTGDDRFLRQSLDWGRQHQWQVGTEKSGANRLFCVETWAELYFIKQDKAMIEPAVRWLDTKAENSPAGADAWYLEGGRRYADSLYGACALVMLSKATGDKKYVDYMHAFFQDVRAELYDADDGLFYRDKRFIGQTTENGKKVFWSRGNGWVIAGLVRILEHLPEDDPLRPRYVELFQTMAAAIAERQGADGLWRPNLDDPEDIPTPETSGTGFFCYALAWGINNDLLEREVHEPVVTKAWAGLVRSVGPDGKVQWGQLVGDRPVDPDQADTHEYVTGTFLLAGSEMYRLLQTTRKPKD